MHCSPPPWRRIAHKLCTTSEDIIVCVYMNTSSMCVCVLILKCCHNSSWVCLLFVIYNCWGICKVRRGIASLLSLSEKAKHLIHYTRIGSVSGGGGVIPQHTPLNIFIPINTAFHCSLEQIHHVQVVKQTRATCSRAECLISELLHPRLLYPIRLLLAPELISLLFLGLPRFLLPCVSEKGCSSDTSNSVSQCVSYPVYLPHLFIKCKVCPYASHQWLYHAISPIMCMHNSTHF